MSNERREQGRRIRVQFLSLKNGKRMLLFRSARNALSGWSEAHPGILQTPPSSKCSSKAQIGSKGKEQSYLPEITTYRAKVI